MHALQAADPGDRQVALEAYVDGAQRDGVEGHVRLGAHEQLAGDVSKRAQRHLGREVLALYRHVGILEAVVGAGDLHAQRFGLERDERAQCVTGSAEDEAAFGPDPVLRQGGEEPEDGAEVGLLRDELEVQVIRCQDAGRRPLAAAGERRAVYPQRTVVVGERQLAMRHDAGAFQHQLLARQRGVPCRRFVQRDVDARHARQERRHVAGTDDRLRQQVEREALEAGNAAQRRAFERQ